ncbi:MAG: glutathione S-transferase [Pseudomonadota bacterium]
MAQDAHAAACIAAAALLAEAVNAHCPWSGKPISADALATYRGNVVGFCNPGCRDKFLQAVTAFDAAIAPPPSRD